MTYTADAPPRPLTTNELLEAILDKLTTISDQLAAAPAPGPKAPPGATSAVLAAIQARTEPATKADIYEATDVSSATLNRALAYLVGTGHVIRGSIRKTTAGRPQIVYTTLGNPALAHMAGTEPGGIEWEFPVRPD